MTDKRDEALKLALELLDKQWQCTQVWSLEEAQDVADNIREALADHIVDANKMVEQPAQQQEPVFWYRPCSNGMYEGPLHNAQIERIRKESGAWHPLYTSPPATKPWASLTDEEIQTIWRQSGHMTVNEVCCAIEIKLREKNA